MRRRNPGPTPRQVRDHMAGMDALYRTEAGTEAERIAAEFRDGASADQLRGKYPHRDVDVILRQRAWPNDGEAKR